MAQVWNGYGTDTQLNITFQVLHVMVWNGGVWNGIHKLDPELWIGVWVGMCARACSAWTVVLSELGVAARQCVKSSRPGSIKPDRLRGLALRRLHLKQQEKVVSSQAMISCLTDASRVAAAGQAYRTRLVALSNHAEAKRECC